MNALVVRTYFRCVARDGRIGYGSIMPPCVQNTVMVVTEAGISTAPAHKLTPISKAERDAGLRACYDSPAWTELLPLVGS